MYKIKVNIPVPEGVGKEELQVLILAYNMLYGAADNDALNASDIVVLDDDNHDVTKEVVRGITPDTILVAKEYLRGLRKG